MNSVAYDEEEKFDESREEDERNGPNSVHIDMTNGASLLCMILKMNCWDWNC